VEPLISILIPAFNAQKCLAETIESALGQSWPRKEIIIVDDGSKDQTLAVARLFANKEVSVVSQSNQGAAAARNKAYSLCQGDYIQWLDADDLLGPDKIARQMALLRRYGSRRALVSSAWGYFYYRAQEARFRPTALWCDLTPAEWMTRKWEQNVFMQTGAWLVSRELTEAAGPWDTRLLGDDDGEYFSRVILKCDRVGFVPEAKVFYRRSAGSLAYIGRSQRKKEAQFLGMRLQIGYLLSLEESARTRAACLNYLQTWLPFFYPEMPRIVEESQQLAATLGGQLHIPRLSWKYAWIQRAFGNDAAKRSFLYYNQSKGFCVRSWYKLLFLLDRNGSGEKEKLAAFSTSAKCS
jgi:glycosyltransferase involved in cell wall biosynthesis